MNTNNIELETETPKEKEQRWEKTRKLFRDAALPLTQEQEAQMRQAEDELEAELKQTFQGNLNKFIGLIAVFFLPQRIQEIIAPTILSNNPIVTYYHTAAQILSPEQKEIWDRSFSDGYWSLTGDDI